MKFFKKTAICLICIVTVAFCATGVTAAGGDGTTDGYIRYEEARAVSSDEVYLGGIPFGIRLYSGELRVIGFTKIDSENGDESPAYDAGIRENDVIVSVNGKAVDVERVNEGFMAVSWRFRGGRGSVRTPFSLPEPSGRVH